MHVLYATTNQKHVDVVEEEKEEMWPGDGVQGVLLHRFDGERGIRDAEYNKINPLWMDFFLGRNFKMNKTLTHHSLLILSTEACGVGVG